MDVQKLYRKGLLIDPGNLDRYLRTFRGSHRRRALRSGHWSGKRVLVTGISGFAGSHLAEKLLSMGCDVAGLIRRHSVPEYPNLVNLLHKVTLFEGDLTDANSIFSMMKAHEPQVVFHLGAQSFVPTSFQSPVDTYAINILGSAHLLEACRQFEGDLEAIHIACTSEEYGKVLEGELPIRETTPLRPQSPYAVSKVAMETIALTHLHSYGIPVRITRGFNHTGPRRGLKFVTSVICRQMTQITRGGPPVVTIGNPNPIRDISDVRDILHGYLLAVERGRDGEVYNLGHGLGITIGNLVRLAAQVAGVSRYRVKIDRSRFRAADVDALICDYSKAKREIGYLPTLPLTRSLQDNMAYLKANPRLLSIG